MVAHWRRVHKPLAEEHQLQKRFVVHCLLLLLIVTPIYFGSEAANINPIGYHQENGFLDGRVHQIANFIGETASLPCEVDFAGCGKIYFITWSKNVSNEWQRVYLYSQSYQMALGEFADGGRRVKLDAANMSTTGLAFLKIESLSVADEGTFKCDVTYVHGKCPSLTYTKLYTLVIPGEPEIRINGKQIDTKSEVAAIHQISGKPLEKESNAANQIGPFSEGSTISLECSTSGGRPLPEVKWWNGSRPLRSKITVSESNKEPVVTSTIKFIISRYDLGKKFECRVWNNATAEPIGNWMSLDIHVKPLTLRVRGPLTPVVAGEMISLSCVVEGARPAASIEWFNRSEVVSPHPPATTDLMNDGTFRTSSTLVFIASRYDHNGDFFCKGTNLVLKSRNEVPLLQSIALAVLYPPAVSIQPEGRVFVNETGSVTLSCTFDANPPNVTEITWYRDGQIVNMKELIIGVKQFPSITIQNITRNETGFYSCHLKNSFGRGNSTTSTFIDVLYSPLVVIELSASVVIETYRTLVTLRCLVIHGNPKTLTQVQWFMNDQLIDTTVGDNASELQLRNVSRSHAGNYSCQGWNGSNKPSRRSAPQQLQVQCNYACTRYHECSYCLRADPGGKAILSMVDKDPESVIKGSSVTLKCSVDDNPGNPPVEEYIWTLNGRRIKEADSAIHHIPAVTVDSQGNYSCAAVNKVAVGSYGFFELRAKAPPRLIHGLPPQRGSLRNQSFSLFCRVECQPRCRIEWFRNNETLEIAASASEESHNLQLVRRHAAFFYEIETVEHNAEFERNLFPSLSSYFHVKNNSWIEDNDVFSCASDSNGIGPPVNSSTIYKVEYPPENVQISVVQLEIVEGELLSDDLIYCTASANPKPTYHWKSASTDSIVARGPFLVFNSSRVSRDHSGNYTCVASNKHGVSGADLSVTVLYRPECFVRKDYVDEKKVLLTCDTQANPPVFNFTWFKHNTSVTEPSLFPKSSASTAIGSRQISTLILNDSELEAYSCVSSNLIGNSKPCRLEVQQINGWVRLLLKEENLIIVAAVAAAVVFIIVSTLVIILICVVRRKLKGLRQGKDDHSSHHYSSGVLNAGLENKIQILEERTHPDGRCSDNSGCDMEELSGCTPQKSPLISAGHQCISLKPDGSPLLSDYLTDDNDSEPSPSSSSPSIHHYYEQPSLRPHRFIHSSGHFNIPLPPPPPKRTHHHRPAVIFNHHPRIT
ncbi:hemicentin-1-like isoform X2 [Dinothrombium tinctorium]|uniref:Hemicentin-1-like isoform X2 n=1 Tax=Dinothrombium tinctorium TaxID=1965070 RepID=A0A3S4RDT8_9ACAR|nr:hemicentin-1-like isoform X2 [Dinothrombium tinctorium]